MTKCKGIPGNIGLLRARSVLYDHCPFWARPYQNTCYPFTVTAGAEITGDKKDAEGTKANKKNTEQKQNVSFQFGEAFLTPLDISFCNFLATFNYSNGKRVLDLIGTKSSTDIKKHLPGGTVYEQDDPEILTSGKRYFPHLLWIYEGSDLYPTEIIHPSQYPQAISLQDTTPLQAMSEFTRRLLLAKQNAPKWAMYSESNPKESGQLNRVYPVMTARKGCRNCGAIHWTLKKYTPLFQGQDFCIELKFPDKISHDWSMTETDAEEELKKNHMNYPFRDYYEPAYAAAGNWYRPWLTPEEWEPGVSNPAFFLPLGDVNEKDIDKDAVKNWIKDNYLNNKSYVIIELGVGQEYNANNQHDSHNYFIELIRGKNPRLLHFGYELRGFDGQGPGNGFGYKTDLRKKLRVLSQFEELSVDDLFLEDTLKIFVRQHMGDIIITFSSRPEIPWRISREDFVLDSNTEVVKERKPMVIPHGELRVHGGNMTVGVCFNHTLYSSGGTVVFRDRQADIGEAVDNDIYATFAHPGDNDGQIGTQNSISKRAGLFKDPQFGNLKMGYDVDAYYSTEIHKNRLKTVSLYQTYSKNYKLCGREWALRDITTEESPTILQISPIRSTTNKTVTLSSFDLSGISEIGPEGIYIGKWDVAIYFKAGTIALEGVDQNSPTITIDGYSISDGAGAIMKNNVTPVATAWNLLVLGGGKVITEDMTEDISEFVETISDGWSSEGYSSINHEAKVTLYLPVGTGFSDTDAKVNRLLSLIDKTFYITISYWWQEGMGLDKAVQYEDNTVSSTLDPEDDPRLIQITGIAYGAQIERSVNKVKMTFEVKDYMEPLKQTYVWNCPFFDSVSDVSAIYELAKMAGLDDSSVANENVPGQQDTEGIDRRPLGFMRQLVQTKVQGLREPIIYNEEKHVHQYFALPGSYADINNPVMRFNNGTPYKDIMEKLVKLYGKTMYFDRYGVLIVEVSPAKLAAFRNSRVNPENPDAPVFDVDIEDLIKAAFVTSPRNKIWDVEDKEYVDFDAEIHTPFLVYNNYTVKRNVADAINHISMMSASAPDSGVAGFLVKGRTFYDQIWDPQSEGFFGYRKAMWHQDGIYGDDKSLNAAMSFYARFKYPPYQVHFETFGVPGLKAFDVILLDRQPLYITEINHDLDPKTNNWWMTISGEWIKSFDDELLLPKTTESDITNPAE